MAQERKHLIQGLLGESTYPAVPVFYDIAGWNHALFLNLEGGSSGQRLQGNPNKYGTVVRDLGPTPRPPRPRTVPRVAVWLDDRFNYTTQSVGWFRHTWTEHWGLSGDGLTVIDHTDIRTGRLSEFDVLVIPEGASSSGLRLLDRADPDDAATEDGLGTAAMRALVHGGGTLIAWRQAARLVSKAGLGTTDYEQPDVDIPGSLLRLRVDQESPLAEGVGPFVWAQNENDHVLVPGEGVAVPVRYPELDHDDFFVSGWAGETEGIGGTAAVTDEQVGAGRVVLFAFDVTFRAMAEGTARLLWNVLFGTDSRSDAKVATQTAGRRPGRDRTARGRDEVPERDGAAPMVLSVDAESAPAARAVVRSVTEPLGLAVEESVRGKVHRFFMANPHELDEEGHPFAHELPGALRAAGVRFRSLSLPN